MHFGHENWTNCMKHVVTLQLGAIMLQKSTSRPLMFLTWKSPSIKDYLKNT
uniref:Alternative protein CDC16 n=1 Tax=Homo sapiens TaxID=9606 RepID=L8E7J3_HUMAN|nr:alternative protein CDC16 [Homo sapiens]